MENLRPAQEQSEFQASLNYSVRPCLRNTGKERLRGWLRTIVALGEDLIQVHSSVYDQPRGNDSLFWPLLPGCHPQIYADAHTYK